MTDEYVSITKAAEMLGLKKHQVMPFVRRHKIMRFYKQSKSVRKISLCDINAYITSEVLRKMNV